MDLNYNTYSKRVVVNSDSGNQNTIKIWVPTVAQKNKDKQELKYKIFNSKIFYSVVNKLEPNDLLSLYIANRNIFTQDILNLLNSKYKINPVTNFTAFIKLYNLSIKPYLYELENIVRLPSIEFLNKERNVTQRMRAMLYDWLLDLNQAFKRNDYILGLTMTLLDAYISQVDILKEDFQSLGIVCHYLACQVLEEICPKINDYLMITNYSTNLLKFENLRIHVVDTLKGVIIRPSVVFFLDMNNSQMKHFALLSYVTARLMIYKPSLIAEAIRYILTKEYKIYTLNEINPICHILVSLIKNSERSILKSIKKLGLPLYGFKDYQCDDEVVPYVELLYNNHEWHIGEYEEIATIGEGTYGKIVKIKRKACNKNFVIKKSKKSFEPALLELSVLKLLKSDYIIDLCGFQLRLPDKVDLYLPFMNSTVENLVMFNFFNMDKFLIYAKQMISGLYECHRYDIIHRDIKPNNIVYDEKEDVFKLIDFGLSVPYASLRKSLNPRMASTFPYRAPEALFGLNYNYKIDIWALGCVFYYIFTKKYIVMEDNWNMDTDALNDIFKLFGTPTDKEWPGIDYLINDNYLSYYDKKEKYLRQVFGQYYDFIMPCFILNPANRPDTIQLLK